MKSHTKLKLRFRRLILLGSALAALGLAQARAEETTVEIVHYFNVQGQIDALGQLQKDFEAANPDVKLHSPTCHLGNWSAAHCRWRPCTNRRPFRQSIIPTSCGSLKPEFSRISPPMSLRFSFGVIYIRAPKQRCTDGSKVYGVPIGSNSLALYYNKKLLTDGGVSAPPQTWEQLTETATKTTKSPVYGIAFSAVNTEEATWQWEPFLWSNGGSLSDLASPNAKVALELWVDWVKKGLASKDVVNWNQGDVPNEFISGRAATMVMGPWQLANVKKSGIDFGIVTIPVPKEGSKPVVPLGGEVWCVLKGNPKVEAAAVKFVQFTQEPSRLRKICDTFNYISSIQSVAKEQGEANPELMPFVDQMATAKARSQDGGAKYPEISLAARTAIQRALTGQATAEDALKEAAAKIKTILSK